MGFLKKLAGFGKKVLGGVVNAGRAVQTIRDKGVGLFNKMKDSLPGPLKSAIDTGLEWAMNTPVGGALKKASGMLDAGVGVADEAYKKLSEYEGSSGTPVAKQLQFIGEKVQEGSGSSPGPGDDQQANRLTALKQE